MTATKDRTATPPPTIYPLTPPPTGGLGKEGSFANCLFPSNTIRLSSTHKEGESPKGFFEGHEEKSDVDSSKISEESSIAATSDTSLASPTLETFTLYGNVVKGPSLCAPRDIGISERNISTPFPLLDLPLSVRAKVYEYMLVIPALICVRQNHTPFHDEKKAYLYAERRELRPGISYALAQATVGSHKRRFSRFPSTNINILLASKEIHAEARAILYGKNAFEIVRPTTELTPPVDFSVRLFPPGCQRLVTELVIRIHTFYDLSWLLGGGYNQIKNFYRGLATLTLLLEFESARKGFGKQWARMEGEKWRAYVKRLHNEIVKDMRTSGKAKKVRAVPTWMDLRVVFDGEKHFGSSDEVESAEKAKRDELRYGLVEGWELLKKGGR